MKTLQIHFTAALLSLAAIHSASAQIWKVAGYYIPQPWTSIASSADGNRLLAVAANGLILTSTDRGGTWITNNAPVAGWTAAASSADGLKSVAVNFSGSICTNSGTNWAACLAVPGANWTCVASSASGSNLVAAGTYIISSTVYYSTNAGASWRSGASPYYPFKSIAFAGDGKTVFAADGGVYVSTNAGAAWTALANSPPINFIVSATNGLNLAGFSAGVTNSIYTSTDGGASWATNTVATSALTALATSADGTRLVAAASGVGIYNSADGGTNWVESDAGGGTWTSVASSADGTQLAASSQELLFVGMTPLPKLTLTPAGASVFVSWPTNVAGYSLYLFTGTNVTTMPWSFAPLPIVTNGVYRVTLPVTNSPSFFWLAPAV